MQMGCRPPTVCRRGVSDTFHVGAPLNLSTEFKGVHGTRECVHIACLLSYVSSYDFGHVKSTELMTEQMLVQTRTNSVAEFAMLPYRY